MNRGEAIKVLRLMEYKYLIRTGSIFDTALEMAIEALRREQPDEWCTDCKEYDAEKKCCPRFNKVIRGAVADALEAVPSADRPRGEWISKEELIDAINDAKFVYDGEEDGHKEHDISELVRATVKSIIDNLSTATKGEA